MNFTLTKDGFQVEGEDFVSIDEIVGLATSAGFNVEVTNEETTLYMVIDGNIVTDRKMATVIRIKP